MKNVKLFTYFFRIQIFYFLLKIYFKYKFYTFVIISKKNYSSYILVHLHEIKESERSNTSVFKKINFAGFILFFFHRIVSISFIAYTYNFH